ncbi:vitamin B12 dependent methionine synthase [candidate division KSB1 bacterium]
MNLLNDIPFKPSLEDILKKLRLPAENREIITSIEEIIEIVHSTARPKAVYKVSYIDNKNNNSVCIDGVTFTSRVLRVNLDKVERVFPYIATCGKEMDEITAKSDDFVINYCLDTIKGMALKTALDYLSKHISDTYMTGKLSKMNPGSLEDWPISQQKELFSVFSNTENTVGVNLSDSYLMIPVKSVSGILFPTKVIFESCKLCPREVCDGRRKPYDPEEVKKYKNRQL